MVGANSPYAIERHFLKYLKCIKTLEAVELFEAQNIFLHFYKKNLFNKILYRLGYQKILHTINKLLLKKVEEFKPTVVLVFKGMEIFPSTLIKIKHLGIKITNYNPDNPFIFSGKGSGNLNITKSIGLYDLHFTYNLNIQKELKEKFPSTPVEYLPFGYELSDELYDKASKQKEINKVCFLGNPDKFRTSFVTILAKNGIEIDVFGNNWSKWVNHKNITCFHSVYNDDFWLTLRRYRIQLNLMRPHNEDSHNMRTFEIPAVGGIQLVPRNQEHAIFFNENEEFFLYDSIEECIAKIKLILVMSQTVSAKIRKSARKRSLQAGYSYEARSQTIFDTYKRTFAAI